MNEIITFLIVIISVLIGYFIGSKNNPISEENVNRFKGIVKKVFEKHDLGAVSTPTAQQVDDWNNPLVQEEKEEMNKAFKEIVPKQ